MNILNQFTASIAKWRLCGAGLLGLGVLVGGPVESVSVTDPAEIRQMVEKAYDWQATRLEPNGTQGIIGWRHAAFYTGVLELNQYWPEPYQLELLRGISETVDWKILDLSNRAYDHADNHLIGEAYLYLYEADGRADSSRVEDTVQVFDRMIGDGKAGRVLYWWCDALFMSPPVWAMLSAVTGDTKYLEEMDRLFWDATDFLYNPNWNLFYRDSKYFNDVEPNGSPVFWSRGNGWVVGGLARILRYLPDDWPTRGQYETLFRMMCERLRRLQMDSGGWASSLAYPGKFDNETEASGTAFFIYGIASGINSGLLDRTRYGPVVEKGWAELSSYLNADGSIRNIQVVGQKPGAYEGGYDKREYGYGAFIMAGVQMAAYYSEATDPTSWSGYPVVAADGQLWVDTGGFLGWLELSHRPWQYVLSLQNWAWIEETDAIQEQGNWVYLIKP